MTPRPEEPAGGSRWPAVLVAAAVTLVGAVLPARAGPGGAAPSGATTVDTTVDADRLLRRARATYDSLETLRASFHQVIEMQVFDPPRRREGRGAWYQEKPGLFRMDFAEPEGDLVVSDGRSVWLFYPSTHPGQVMRTGLEEDGTGRSEEIVDLQGRILERARRGYEATYGGRATVDGQPTHLLELAPRSRQSAYASLRIWIDAERWLVRKLEFTDRSETVRTITLDELETGVDFPDSLFRFEPPEDVEVFEG